MRRALTLCTTALTVLVTTSAATANSVTLQFSGSQLAADSGGNPLGGSYAAGATFVFTDDGDGTATLGIQFSNVSFGVLEPGDSELSGLFFDFGVAPSQMDFIGLGADPGSNALVDSTLNPYSAVAGEDAADYWFLERDAGNKLDAVGGQQYSLHSAGFFNLGSGDGEVDNLDAFTTGNSGGPDGGILSTVPGVTGAPNGWFATGNPSDPANINAFVADGWHFLFDLGAFDIADASIENVWAQFGTSNDQPGFSLVIVPVPPAAVIGGIGLLAAGVLRRRMTA